MRSKDSGKKDDADYKCTDQKVERSAQDGEGEEGLIAPVRSLGDGGVPEELTEETQEGLKSEIRAVPVAGETLKTRKLDALQRPDSESVAESDTLAQADTHQRPAAGTHSSVGGSRRADGSIRPVRKIRPGWSSTLNAEAPKYIIPQRRVRGSPVLQEVERSLITSPVAAENSTAVGVGVLHSAAVTDERAKEPPGSPFQQRATRVTDMQVHAKPLALTELCAAFEKLSVNGPSKAGLPRRSD